MSLLGIDIGTTGCKAVAFDLNGGEIARSYREYHMLESEEEGIYELNPEIVWLSVKACIVEVNRVDRISEDPVTALSISVSGDEIIPIDRNGNILFNTIMSMDKRGSVEAKKWLESYDKFSLYSITGLPIHPKYGINRIMWLRENKPELYEKAWKFLTWEDFIFLKLGISDLYCDYSSMARLMIVDIVQKSWASELLEFAGLTKDMFSKIAPPGTPIGNIPRALSSGLGFKVQPEVVTGGFDQSCAALGAGIVESGLAMVGTGTMEALIVFGQKPKFSNKLLEGNYPWNLHAVPNTYNCTATNVGGGLVLKWFRDTFAYQEIEFARNKGLDPYNVILNDLDMNPTKLLLLPHFAGSGPPYKDSGSMGAIIGITSKTSRKDIIKGILEGITYELMQNIEYIETLGEIKINELRAVGGGAKSDFWLQLKANMTGKVVSKPVVSEAGCLAAACLAGTGIGLFKDLKEALGIYLKIEKVFEPNFSVNREYKWYFNLYKELYPKLKSTFHGIRSYK